MQIISKINFGNAATPRENVNAGEFDITQFVTFDTLTVHAGSPLDCQRPFTDEVLHQQVFYHLPLFL